MKNIVLVATILFQFHIVRNQHHGHHGGEHSRKAQKPLWNYYGKAKIDLEHVLHETKTVAKLQEENKISVEDAAFYYHRLHDFNSDGYLDGLELLHSTKHSIEAHENSTQFGDYSNLERLADFVDKELELFDYDGNGLVDFGELTKYILENTEKREQ